MKSIYKASLARCLGGALSGILMLSLALPASAAVEYIFSAPPRGPADKETKVYGPIADYLSQATGKKIVYRHPGNWLTYQSDMQKGAYDIVFDGPHFASWRIAKTQHEPLAKLPGQLAFIVMVKNDEQRVRNVQDLRGRTVCGLAPPNLATLTLYSLFDNPARQPLIIEAASFPKAYEGVMNNRCAAAVMRDKMFFKLDNKNKKGRAVFTSRGIANQTFTAGPRLTSKEKQAITNALLDPKSTKTMEAFHKRFNKKGKPILRASLEEYTGLHLLLKDVWGFGER